MMITHSNYRNQLTYENKEFTISQLVPQCYKCLPIHRIPADRSQLGLLLIINRHSPNALLYLCSFLYGPMHAVVIYFSTLNEKRLLLYLPQRKKMELRYGLRDFVTYIDRGINEKKPKKKSIKEPEYKFHMEHQQRHFSFKSRGECFHLYTNWSFFW